MKNTVNRLSRIDRRVRAISIVMGGVLFQASAGCIPIIGTEFRSAALPAIENGVDIILDGLVDGIFAAIRPENTSTE